MPLVLIVLEKWLFSMFCERWNGRKSMKLRPLCSGFSELAPVKPPIAMPSCIS